MEPTRERNQRKIARLEREVRQLKRDLRCVLNHWGKHEFIQRTCFGCTVEEFWDQLQKGAKYRIIRCNSDNIPQRTVTVRLQEVPAPIVIALPDTSLKVIKS